VTLPRALRFSCSSRPRSHSLKRKKTPQILPSLPGGEPNSIYGRMKIVEIVIKGKGAIRRSHVLRKRSLIALVRICQPEPNAGTNRFDVPTREVRGEAKSGSLVSAAPAYLILSFAATEPTS